MGGDRRISAIADAPWGVARPDLYFYKLLYTASVKVRTEVSAEKLRGGFYTPEALALRCLENIARLVPGDAALAMLEPAAGDGAFVRALRKSSLGRRVSRLDAVELLAAEAEKSRAELQQAALGGEVVVSSVLAWGLNAPAAYDAAFGNPPFVRFQFVSTQDKAMLPLVAQKLGLPLRAVSNLWIPVLLTAVSHVRPGGAFSFVVPTELLTGVSAAAARRWLLANCGDLRLELFPPGSFPGVLQEVAILSGRRDSGAADGSIEILDADSSGTGQLWSHVVRESSHTWTRFLLTPAELAAYEDASTISTVLPLRMIAKFEVAAVTGANDFFSVSRSEIAEYELSDWVLPLLARARNVRGLRYTAEDHQANVASGVRAGLLDFSSIRPDPTNSEKAQTYLRNGEAVGLHTRFKTRIRSPWYRVPHIKAGRLMLSKRAHRYARLIVNEAEAVTTDTLYRGWMQATYAGREADLAASFHNSLTLLSTEIEGRSFGGGVLELVPSEISRLAIPLVLGAGSDLDRLAKLTSDAGEVTDALVHETDRIVARHGRLPADLIASLRTGLSRVQGRRLARTSGRRAVDAAA